eukprot:TRINITY_DN1326_c0_g1_i4.p1 TRINITY_DN1326_c0_g1~~TRINITY_DN1326_c0_g1_i4.p1  ORF type:complete len:338 (-),score=16.74 TRINITY_DN1326_c0_g1_i4:996-2009(-)
MVQILLLFYFAQSVQTTCENSLEFIHSGPKVHGKVEKKALLPVELWWKVPFMSYYNIMKESMYEQKIALHKNQILQDGMVPKYPVKLPLSERCYVLISYEHKLIYVKIAKTGGNSLIGMFGKQCRKFGGSDKVECVKGNFVRPTIEDIPDRETAQRLWKEFVVFTGVRNPYARGASAYMYLLGRRKLKNDSDPECANWPSFQQFCKAPFIVGLQTETYNCTGHQFHDYVHVEPHTPCIANEYGEFFVDYILNLENIEQDYQSFMQELMNHPGTNETSKEYFRKISELEFRHVNAVASTKSYAYDMFDRCGQDCVQSLADYYNDDFKYLGYQKCIYGA